MQGQITETVHLQRQQHLSITSSIAKILSVRLNSSYNECASSETKEQ